MSTHLLVRLSKYHCMGYRVVNRPHRSFVNKNDVIKGNVSKTLEWSHLNLHQLFYYDAMSSLTFIAKSQLNTNINTTTMVVKYKWQTPTIPSVFITQHTITLKLYIWGSENVKSYLSFRNIKIVVPLHHRIISLYKYPIYLATQS